MLAVENLTKYYRTVRGVEKLSFRVAAGEMVGLLGPNGAGKTTVLRCIAGIVQATDGRITINGHDLSTQEESAKRSLGFVPEVPNPYDLLTLWEHLEFVARAYGKTDGFRDRGERLLHRFDLSAKRDELVLTLSKGMKQKLAIACAFVHNPPVILLDEPLIGIDPRGQRAVKELLTEATAESRSVLISTHILATAEELCDRIIILNQGTMVTEGTLGALHKRANMGEDKSLEDIFLSLTEEQEQVGPADSA
ncbi:MAG: ABC transporter ATP-binding protein [Armatimonadetes bacterium]|nr:ABC transporter ATP-binding protein [Armatimonadota bacterium]